MLENVKWLLCDTIHAIITVAKIKKKRKIQIVWCGIWLCVVWCGVSSCVVWCRINKRHTWVIAQSFKIFGYWKWIVTLKIAETGISTSCYDTGAEFFRYNLRESFLYGGCEDGLKWSELMRWAQRVRERRIESERSDGMEELRREEKWEQEQDERWKWEKKELHILLMRR